MLAAVHNSASKHVKSAATVDAPQMRCSLANAVLGTYLIRSVVRAWQIAVRGIIRIQIVQVDAVQRSTAQIALISVDSARAKAHAWPACTLDGDVRGKLPTVHESASA